MSRNDRTYMKRLQRTWDVYGKDDPMFAILADSEKRRGKWDRKEFFDSGKTEIQENIDYLHSLGLNVQRDTALDFGCGIGRLTQALAHHFSTCIGVDIAPSMIDLANEQNAHGKRCEYVLNENTDLSIFEDSRFDFVYCSKVLQHIDPTYSTIYIREFLRLLKPGGILVFQLPSEKLKVGKAREVGHTLRGLLRAAVPTQLLEQYRLKRYGSSSNMDMYHVPRHQVETIIKTSGCVLVDIVDNSGSEPAFVSLRYCVTKS